MKRVIRMSKYFVAGILMLVLFVKCNVAVEASVNKLSESNQKYVQTIEVPEDEITQYGLAAAFRRTLDKADQSGTLYNDKGNVKVIVPAGNYELTNAIQINYCNITADFTDCFFVQKKGNTNSLLRIGEADNTRTGYYYKNITIIGGVFDGNGTSSTLFKTAHSKNIILNGTSFKNTKNGHLVEVAGVDGLTFSNCRFSDQVLNEDGAKKVTYEAIQIDILTHDHLNGYLSETLATRDVLVENCIFDNVPRGVGSHTTILNCPVDGVTIKNNEFKNMGSIAVQGLNWKNVTISDNIIKNSPRGIALYGLFVRGTYLPSEISKEDGISTKLSDKYQKPSSNQKISITGNKIYCKGKEKYADYLPVGIYVGGLKLNKSTQEGRGSVVPKGDYYISGVKIKNNEIQSVGYGIRLEDAKKVVVSSNKLKFVGKKSGDEYHGIQLRMESQCSEISNNTIDGYNTNGIYLNTASKTTTISGNKISNVGKYGIGIEQSKVTTIKKNTIKKAKIYGINVNEKAEVEKIVENKLSQCGEKIHVSVNSKVKKLGN